METVFVRESLIDYNQWTSDNNQFQKMKIGEIFQLMDSSISLCCLNCSQEFQYFTEFTLHIQEHFMRGEIAKLKEVKEEVPSESQNEAVVDDSVPQNEGIIVKCEVIRNDADDDDFFNDDSEMRWSDDDVNSVLMDQRDAGLPTENLPKNVLIVEGTDYEKLNDKFKCLTCDHEATKWNQFEEHVLNHSNPKDVMCPICSKIFASYAYTQKHCNRTHSQKISLEKIKEAQAMRYKKEASVVVPTAPPPPPKQKINPKPEKRMFDGTDYKKVDDKFQCLTCNRKMAKLDHMKEHLLTHTSEKNVLCPFCARAFITEAYVRKHVNRSHNNIRITAEEIRAAQSTIDVSLKKKEWEMQQKRTQMIKAATSSMTATAAAEEGTVRCLFCEKRFTKARYAQKHMRLIHGKPIAIGDVVSCQPIINGSDGTKFSAEKDDGGGISKEVACVGEEPEKKFECFECHKQFVSLNSVRIHMKLHSGIKYICPYCGKVFAMKSYVRDHIVIMHGMRREDIPKESVRQVSEDFIYTPRPNVALYECYLCRNQYRKRNRLREHMNTHMNGPFLCVICGAVYKSTDTLRHHMERHKANPDEPHQCTDCGKMYPTRRYMLSHYRTIHLNKRRKKSTVPVERKYDITCEICEKKFMSQHNLNQHQSVHNRDPKELICHVCGWEFKERSNLKQHLESHGNNKTTCEICNKVLSHRYLQEHMKIHGNKEFQCSNCGMQFVSQERLKRHMVRHSGEPKYKCDLCPKAYTRSDKLLYHRRTHDQQMTHECRTCGKGFFSIKSLRKHENKHYLEDNGLLKSNNLNI
ncbi:zinc finger protein 699-like [Sitodiplosis mosellana]|uniref:zinc finger protein 699-like n=1 Tax=Sitodiplosis mosellana TaxID=263140 RepID=UPI002444B543|nr:zinc finger protein 699-like [Sitodiplosis mosellana]